MGAEYMGNKNNKMTRKISAFVNFLVLFSMVNGHERYADRHLYMKKQFKVL